MKKKIFVAIFTLFLGLIPINSVKAQTCNFNDPVTSTNAPICCPSTYAPEAKKCTDFCVNNPNEIFCGTGIRGGGTTRTQNTNATNSSTTSGSIAPTPQASSKALNSCNAVAFDSLLDILIWLKCVIGSAIIPLLFTFAFLYFLWGMVQYIRNADNEKKREESKKFIYYGILGLTVMVSIWGIVRIVTSTFGLGNTVPQLQTDCLSTNKNNPCR